MIYVLTIAPATGNFLSFSLLVALLSANLVGSCLDGFAFLSYEISELSFPLRFYLCVYCCHETCP